MALLSYLEPGDPFPPTTEALSYPNGLLAAGGKLDTATLVAAYRRGIFPWYEAPQPVLWWSPDPRSVLIPDNLYVSRSLRKTLRRGDLTITRNTAFRDVVTSCAAPRAQQAGTWIDSAMANAYAELNDAGWAHSVEVWRDGQLIGGLYGVAIGCAFFGESMFSRSDDASKVALVALALTIHRGGGFIDCQIESEHLNSLGARNLDRVDFENLLQHTVRNTLDDSAWGLPIVSDELLQRWTDRGSAGAQDS